MVAGKINNVSRAHVAALLRLIAIGTAIAFSALVLHESGHFATGYIIGCTDVSFGYDYSPYVSMHCSPQIQSSFMGALAFSGFLFVAPLALAMARYRRHFAYTLIGFNFLISFSDLLLISSYLATAFAVAGVFAFSYGHNAAADTYLKKLLPRAV